jgi:hypothetical protein
MGVNMVRKNLILVVLVTSATLTYLSNRTTTPPSKDYLRKIMKTSIGIQKKKTSSVHTTNVSPDTEDPTPHPLVHHHNVFNISYFVNRRDLHFTDYSLVDRGANGGLFGSDIRILSESDCMITISNWFG